MVREEGGAEGKLLEISGGEDGVGLEGRMSKVDVHRRYPKTMSKESVRR